MANKVELVACSAWDCSEVENGFSAPLPVKVVALGRRKTRKYLGFLCLGLGLGKLGLGFPGLVFGSGSGLVSVSFSRPVFSSGSVSVGRWFPGWFPSRACFLTLTWRSLRWWSTSRFDLRRRL
jgi:hypothetical protein